MIGWLRVTIAVLTIYLEKMTDSRCPVNDGNGYNNDTYECSAITVQGKRTLQHQILDHSGYRHVPFLPCLAALLLLL